MLENLTAEQLLNFDFGGGDMKVTLLNLLAFLLGVLLNSFREMKKENIGFVDYWTKHGLNSMSSIGALLATFFSMMTMAPGAPLYAYFSMAFMGDALLNKPPVKEKAPADRSLKQDLGKLGDKLEDKLEHVVEKHKDRPMKVLGMALGFVLLVIIVL